MTKDAFVETCLSVDTRRLAADATIKQCRALFDDLPLDKLNDFAVLFDNLVNVSFTMTDASNVTTTTTADTPSLFMDSPRTIAGLSVETFSFIFLAIGGIAPVIFLVIVVTSMKCYKYRQLQKLRRFQERQRIKRSLWEMERNQYFKTHPKPPDCHVHQNHDSADSPYLFNRDSTVRKPHRHSKRGRHGNSQILTVSNSNPDVYFREPRAAPQRNDVSTRSVLRAQKRISHMTTGSLPLKTAHYVQDVAESRLTVVKRHESTSSANSTHAQASINSEEALALQSFDKIYRDLDFDPVNSSFTTSDSERRCRTKPRLSGAKNTKTGASRTSVTGFQRDDMTSSKTVTVDLHYPPSVRAEPAISEESSVNSAAGSERSSSGDSPARRGSSPTDVLARLGADTQAGHGADAQAQQSASRSQDCSIVSTGSSIHDGLDSVDTSCFSYSNTAYLHEDTAADDNGVATVEMTRL